MATGEFDNLPWPEVIRSDVIPPNEIWLTHSPTVDGYYPSQNFTDLLTTHPHSFTTSSIYSTLYSTGSITFRRTPDGNWEMEQQVEVVDAPNESKEAEESDFPAVKVGRHLNRDRLDNYGLDIDVG